MGKNIVVLILLFFLNEELVGQTVRGVSGINPDSYGNLTSGIKAPNNSIKFKKSHHLLVSNNKNYSSGISEALLRLQLTESKQEGIEVLQNNPSSKLPGVGAKSYSLYFEILDFSAILLKNQHVKLTWTAQAEWNAYFEVQRSSNGWDWEVIKNISGGGDSASSTSYSTIDQSPLNGYNYYRLKQVDMNGEFKLFNVISLKAKEEILIETLLFPNPSSGQITVKGQPSELEQLSIINSMGQIQMQNINVTKVSESQMTLNLENLPPGFYILKTASGGKVFRKQ